MSLEKAFFELKVEAKVLTDLMTRWGREVEANGGEYHFEQRGFRTLRWQIRAVPEETADGEAVILTWKCGAWDERETYYPQMDTPCIRWRIIPAPLGVRVVAVCGKQQFNPFFYSSINFAVDMSAKAQEKGVPGKTKGGRKRLQSHQGAIQRLEDGQTKEANFYQWKQEYETETEEDPEHTASGASELYRARVWRVYQRKNRTDETQKSTG